MTPRFRRVASTCIVLFSVLFALAAAELGIRFWRKPLDEHDRFLSQMVGDHHRPGASYWYRGAEFETLVQINSKGLRDRETDYEKPAGVRRILVFGDSFTDALQVPLDQTFVKVMERELLDRAGEDRVEALNAGHVGDGTGRALLRFRHEAHRYKPDLVLLALYLGNDIRNNHPELERTHRRFKYGPDNAALPGPYFDLNDDGELQLHGFPYQKLAPVGSQGASWGVRFRGSLARHSHTYRLVAEFAKALTGKGRTPQSFPSDESPAGTPPAERQVPAWSHLALYRPEYPKSWKEAWIVTENLLAALRDDVRGHGARIAVTVIPPRNEVEEIYWERAVERYPRIREWNQDKPTRLIVDILTRLDVPHLILRDPLRRIISAEGEPFYLPQDGHFNTRGYAAAGRILANWIEQEELLSSDRAASSRDPMVQPVSSSSSVSKISE